VLLVIFTLALYGKGARGKGKGSVPVVEGPADPARR
jgi:hypothetical protein